MKKVLNISEIPSHYVLLRCVLFHITPYTTPKLKPHIVLNVRTKKIIKIGGSRDKSKHHWGVDMISQHDNSTTPNLNVGTPTNQEIGCK